MILTCPSCHARYVLPEGAIGPDGRRVRCAKCSHSWFEEGETILPESVAPDTLPAAIGTPAGEAANVEPAPATAASVDPYAYDPPMRAVRGPGGRWWIAALLAGLLIASGVGLLYWLQSPGRLAQLGLGAAPESPLRLEANGTPERRRLATGNELFALSGAVVNPTNTAQRIPDIVAQLHGADDRVIHQWRIVPSQRTVAAGAKVSFDSAELDVPRKATRLTLSFAD